jgi:hypothetical protein
MRIGIADEFGRQRIEKRFARRSLNMLVHDHLARFPHRIVLTLFFSVLAAEDSATRYTVVLSCILT